METYLLALFFLSMLDLYLGEISLVIRGGSRLNIGEPSPPI
jgi:hypothetical protein